MKIKTGKKSEKEKEVTLSKSDWKAITKLSNLQSRDLLEKMAIGFDELYEAIWVVQTLIACQMEKHGDNPLEVCFPLLALKIYHHTTLIPDVPGLSVERGIVTRDDYAVSDERYDYLYEAKAKGISFGTAYNEIAERE